MKRFIIKIIIVFFISGFYHTTKIYSQCPTKKLEVDFAGNKVFSNQELKAEFDKCNVEYDEAYDYTSEGIVWQEGHDCLEENVLGKIKAKGYTATSYGKLKFEIVNKGVKVTVPINEGLIYKFGKMTVEGAIIISPIIFEQTFPIKSGERVNESLIYDWISEKIEKEYLNIGFNLRDLDIEPVFRAINDKEGIVDYAFYVDEGNAFRVKSIMFLGNEQTRDLKVRYPLRFGETDIFTEERLRKAVERLNQADIVKNINYDKDVEIQYNREELKVNILIKIIEKDSK